MAWAYYNFQQKNRQTDKQTETQTDRQTVEGRTKAVDICLGSGYLENFCRRLAFKTAKEEEAKDGGDNDGGGGNGDDDDDIDDVDNDMMKGTR